MEIECPERMPILEHADLLADGIWKQLELAAPGAKYAYFRAMFAGLWLRTNRNTQEQDWNAVARKLGYTERARHCYIK